MKAKDLVHHIMTSYQPDDEIAYALWSKEDVDGKVIELIGNQEIPASTVLTDEDMENILQSFDHHHDAEYGLTWIGLEEEIKEYVKDLQEVEDE